MGNSGIVGTFLNFSNNIFKVIFTNSYLLVEIICFLTIFIGIFLFGYLFLVKKMFQSLYKYLFDEENRLIILVLALCIFISFLWNLYFWEFTKDDAFITFRYAKNLVEGRGITFNKKRDPVEGYSNFLWVILSTIPLLLNVDIVIYTKVFSVIINYLTVIAVYKFANLFYEKKVALVAPVLYALYYPIHLWAVSCLETPFLIFLFILACYFIYKETITERRVPKFSVI